MGYEFLIRARDATTPVKLPLAAARLERAVREGLGVPPALPAAADAAAASERVEGRTSAPSSEAPAAAESSSQGPWSIPNGAAKLAVRLSLSESGEPRGLDFEVALGGSELELRNVVEFVLGCAELCEGIAFDPQLGRELSRPGVDEVVSRWRESQSYAAEISGGYEDPRGVIEFQAPPPLVSPRTQAVLAFAGGLLLLYWILGAFLDALAK